jgi:1-aminocyclopropane-1-carboxylate deaminase/D-cysteine desulfhydrase-like pyridoxal-dependent ACC family enzyme
MAFMAHILPVYSIRTALSAGSKWFLQPKDSIFHETNTLEARSVEADNTLETSSHAESLTEEVASRLETPKACPAEFSVPLRTSKIVNFFTKIRDQREQTISAEQ